ncbi:COX assembly mitochondrial protein homolog [Anthophora plagiata]
MRDERSQSVQSSGGPHNLGDPDDKSLRKVEKEVLIPQMMRDRARNEKCVQQVKDFTECCKNSNVLMVIKCRKENTALKDCLASWFNDLKFKEECTLKYLEERSEYRRTGVSSKPKLKRIVST